MAKCIFINGTEFKFSTPEALASFLNQLPAKNREYLMTTVKNSVLKVPASDFNIYKEANDRAIGAALNGNNPLQNQPRQPANTTTKTPTINRPTTHPAIAEANSKESIEQNFFDGYRPNSDKTKVHTIRPEITDQYGKGVSTFKLVKEGVRTRTTRLAAWMKKNNPKVGDYFWQTSKKNPNDKVLTRITAVYGKDDPRFKNNWYKEGWVDSDFKYVENYDSAIEFEVIDLKTLSAQPSQSNQPKPFQNISSFETEQGSVYTVLPDGRTQRYKTALTNPNYKGSDKGQSPLREPTDLIMFFNRESQVGKALDNFQNASLQGGSPTTATFYKNIDNNNYERVDGNADLIGVEPKDVVMVIIPVMGSGYALPKQMTSDRLKQLADDLKPQIANKEAYIQSLNNTDFSFVPKVGMNTAEWKIDKAKGTSVSAHIGNAVSKINTISEQPTQLTQTSAIKHREDLFKDKTTVSTREALEFLSKLGDQFPGSGIAQKLLDSLQGDGDPIHLIAETPDGSAGKYDYGQNFINIYENALYPQNRNYRSTVLHEILHYFTLKKVWGDDKFRKQLNDLMKYVRENLPFAITKNMEPTFKNYFDDGNEHEFIVGIFSNRAVIELLKEIKSPKQESKSIFGQFIDMLKSAFKLNKSERTLLEDAWETALPIVFDNQTQNQQPQETKKKLFDSDNKVLKKGAVVQYKGQMFLFWNQNSAGRAQLINTDGTKFSGTPLVKNIKVLGTFPTVIYNNTEYIVTDNGNIYSGATGNLVYTGNDNSSVTQKQRILDIAKNTQVNEPADAASFFNLKGTEFQKTILKNINFPIDDNTRSIYSRSTGESLQNIFSNPNVFIKKQNGSNNPINGFGTTKNVFEQLIGNDTNYTSFIKSNTEEIYNNIRNSKNVSPSMLLLLGIRIAERFTTPSGSFASRLQTLIPENNKVEIKYEIFERELFYNNDVSNGINIAYLDTIVKSSETFEDFIKIVEAYFTEELIHGVFNQITTDEELLGVYNELDKAQINRIKKLYGNIQDQNDEGKIYLAHEYLRMIVQERLSGTVTEEVVKPKLKSIFKKFIDFVKNTFGKTNKIANTLVERFETALSTGIVNKKSKEIEKSKEDNVFNIFTDLAKLKQQLLNLDKPDTQKGTILSFDPIQQLKALAPAYQKGTDDQVRRFVDNIGDVNWVSKEAFKMWEEFLKMDEPYKKAEHYFEFPSNNYFFFKKLFANMGIDMEFENRGNSLPYEGTSVDRDWLKINSTPMQHLPAFLSMLKNENPTLYAEFETAVKTHPQGLDNAQVLEQVLTPNAFYGSLEGQWHASNTKLNNALKDEMKKLLSKSLGSKRLRETYLMGFDASTLFNTPFSILADRMGEQALIDLVEQSKASEIEAFLIKAGFADENTRPEHLKEMKKLVSEMKCHL